MDTISIRRRLYVKTILLLRSHLHEFTTPSSQNVTTAIPGSLPRSVVQVAHWLLVVVVVIIVIIIIVIVVHMIQVIVV
jgi:hypothetical protein